MAWAREEIGMELEELLRAIAAFLDMLVLSAGFQLSGKQVFWDPNGVRKALQWATFLEQAMQRFPRSKRGDSSREVLDIAVADLIDVTPHPPGLPQLSWSLLLDARAILIKALVQSFGIDNGQIHSLLIAADVPGFLQGNEKKTNAIADEEAGAPQVRDIVRDGESEQQVWQVSRKRTFNELDEVEKLPEIVMEEITERRAAKSCMDSSSNGLTLCTECIISSSLSTRQVIPIWRQERPSFSCSCRSPPECICEKWCKEAISYWNSPKTIYKLTGALKIFESEKETWKPVLDLLRTSALGDEIVEVAELCLLYLSSDNWKLILRRLLTAFVPQNASLEENPANPQVSSRRQEEVEDYMLGLLKLRRAIWWKLPPILTAAGSTKNSRLLRHYVESIKIHVDSKNDSGICFCHTCCCKQQCEQCRDAVHHRTWCALFLNTMNPKDAEQLKKLYIQTCGFA